MMGLEVVYHDFQIYGTCVNESNVPTKSMESAEGR